MCQDITIPNTPEGLGCLVVCKLLASRFETVVQGLRTAGHLVGMLSVPSVGTPAEFSRPPFRITCVFVGQVKWVSTRIL